MKGVRKQQANKHVRLLYTNKLTVKKKKRTSINTLVPTSYRGTKCPRNSSPKAFSNAKGAAATAGPSLFCGGIGSPVGVKDLRSQLRTRLEH